MIETLQTVGVVLLALAGVFVYWFVIRLVYDFLTLPARRRERAGIFLDLLERSLDKGKSPEQQVVSLAGAEDKILGLHFHLIAAHVEAGKKLSHALDQVSGFLTPMIRATIKVGEETGCFRQALSVCKKMAGEGTSQLRSAENYLILLLMFFMPIQPFLVWMLAKYVLPKFAYLLAELEVSNVVLVDLWIHLDNWLVFAMACFTALIWMAVVLYVEGPKFDELVRYRSWHPGAWLALRLPWKRNRLIAGFADMLGVLLDGNFPEEKAVLLAARSTANLYLVDRAQKTIASLKSGMALPDALKEFDETGELKWRLFTAAQSNVSLKNALAAWVESLYSKADMQEQTAAQLFTTLIVLVNGVCICLIGVSVFMFLTSIMETGVLW